MGYQSKIKVIERGGIQRQFYLICPAPLAPGAEIERARPSGGSSKTSGL
jgi:hypothetical protein